MPIVLNSKALAQVISLWWVGTESCTGRCNRLFQKAVQSNLTHHENRGSGPGSMTRGGDQESSREACWVSTTGQQKTVHLEHKFGTRVWGPLELTGTPGDMHSAWKHFGLSLWGRGRECVWGPACSHRTYNTQDSPPPYRMTPYKMSLVLILRNPGLNQRQLSRILV